MRIKLILNCEPQEAYRRARQWEYEPAPSLFNLTPSKKDALRKSGRLMGIMTLAGLFLWDQYCGHNVPRNPWLKKGDTRAREANSYTVSTSGRTAAPRGGGPET